MPRDRRSRIRSPRRIRANASTPGGADPPPLPRPQPACGGTDVRARVHGTSAHSEGAINSSRGEFSASTPLTFRFRPLRRRSEAFLVEAAQAVEEDLLHVVPLGP